MIPMKRFLAILIVCCSVGVSAKHKPIPTPTGISLSPTAWQVRYSSGVRLQPLVGMAGWFFDFPADPDTVNYITTVYATPLMMGATVIASVQIVTTAGDPVFDYGFGSDNPCVTPATARLYVEQAYAVKHCPSCDATSAPPTYRWWSNPAAITLGLGAVSLAVPVDPTQWSDTDGHFGVDALQGFSDAIAHPAAIGFTFGGGCFFGHGVSVLGGSARFVLTGFSIQ